MTPAPCGRVAPGRRASCNLHPGCRPAHAAPVRWVGPVRVRDSWVFVRSAGVCCTAFSVVEGRRRRRSPRSAGRLWPVWGRGRGGGRRQTRPRGGRPVLLPSVDVPVPLVCRGGGVDDHEPHPTWEHAAPPKTPMAMGPRALTRTCPCCVGVEGRRSVRQRRVRHTSVTENAPSERGGCSVQCAPLRPSLGRATRAAPHSAGLSGGCGALWRAGLVLGGPMGCAPHLVMHDRLIDTDRGAEAGIGATATGSRASVCATHHHNLIPRRCKTAPSYPLSLCVCVCVCRLSRCLGSSLGGVLAAATHILRRPCCTRRGGAGHM